MICRLPSDGVLINIHSDNTEQERTMPLTQEKPRFDHAFTNNNDHNYLHKKFKKMASTVVGDSGLGAGCEANLHKDNAILHSASQSLITNKSIAAAHPEIEKIKTTEANIRTETRIENNVQINVNDSCSRVSNVNRSDQETGETSNSDDPLKKTDNFEIEVPKDIVNGGASGRYVCPYCKLPCAKPSVLQKHIRAHTNERPYPCGPCGIAFKTKSNLYKHRKSRTHAQRLQGVDSALNEEDWSAESESDTSLPATSASDAGSEAAAFRLDSRTSEFSSPDLLERATPPAGYSAINFDAKSKSIYKPKFRVSLYQDEDERNKRILSPNPDFLNEHISKIISDNEAIVDVIESPLQKKYSKIKQIAENKQLLDNLEVKSEMVPLNLSKGHSELEIVNRKRRHSECFSLFEQKHPLNPEGSIIKDLLLKTKACGTGLLPVTSDTYDGTGVLYICPLCQIPYRSAENLDIHRMYYCKGMPNGVHINSTISKETKGLNTRPEFQRSNSINVKLPETQNSSGKNTPSKSSPNRHKPDNLVIIKPESSDIATPLPSPGPLLGNTRLVDTRVTQDYVRKLDLGKAKPINSPKRRFDSRDAFSPRLNEDNSQRTDLYQQNKMRCLENNPTTLRSLEELSHSPMRQNSLQMFGGEVKILDHSGGSTTLRIEPSRTQHSPITVHQSLSPNKQAADESSVVVRSSLHSGGTMVHNPPTPREPSNSPHPPTPRIMLSIATSIPTPNIVISSLTTPNITHFQFPPLGAITAFNPLTLPPLSPSSSPSGATTILHGGKLIPHVPGIPGPNTPAAPLISSPSLHTRFMPSIEITRSHSVSPKDDSQFFRHSNTHFQNRALTVNKFDAKNSSFPRSLSVNNADLKNADSNASSIQGPIIPTISVKDVDEPAVHVNTHATVRKMHSRITDGLVKRSNDSLHRHNAILKETSNYETKKNKLHEKLNISERKFPEQETRHFNFENLITKAEIYNNSQIPSSSDVQKNTNAQESKLPNNSSERSETSYFQKNCSAKSLKEEGRPRFLRPSTLPLKPGTFTPKKHHGITPNANTMPLVSPETPRPAKAYGQLYLNGNAYTYLGLKCSTKVFYCTVNRPQPTYVPNQHFLSMYSNWQLLSELTPHPLGFSPAMAMFMYDSRHRPQNYALATIKQDHILTHSSQWNRSIKEIKAKQSPMDTKKSDEKCQTSESSSSSRNKELAGGFESNEEYTYVRGRGRGRYVCSECGIRCKKPSMLKKHIRTHTDVRPFTCKHCAFSFKTKGNLTKHMKSKAHYKKCNELGINPSEGTDIDAADMNQGSGEDDDSDSDMDDGNEGETESSDTDSWKSRLPEHEAAQSLLSLWGARHSSTTAPGLLTSARPTTYPYAPTGAEGLTTSAGKLMPSRPSSSRSTSTDSRVDDLEPMDLSKGEVKSNTPMPEIQTARESSVLASLASNTAKLPQHQNQWTNGEPMLHAYLTERALLDTKIKQSQLIGGLSKMRKQEMARAVQMESSNIFISSSYVSLKESAPRSTMASMPTQSPQMTVATNSTKVSIALADIRPLSIGVETTATVSVSTVVSTQAVAVEVNKSPPAPGASEVNTSTENAKFVASEYLKMARGKMELGIDKVHPTVNETQDDIKITNNSQEEIERRESSDKEDSRQRPDHDPVARKVVIGAGGVAFKVSSKTTNFQSPAAFTPGRLMEDGRSVCVVCNKGFSKPSQLRLHINIHYMERPYRCSACAVSFRTKGHLQKHERSGSHHNKVSMTSTFGAATSLNPRPFRCSDCNIAFRIHGHLAKHLRSKMHVMRLECLGKLPFGTFAEIERAGVSLTDIDTTDCANSLASLQLLAQKLHEKDPTKLESWDPSTMVPPLLPAGRESSDDEDLVMDNKLSESERDMSDVRTTMNIEHNTESRNIYSATDI